MRHLNDLLVFVMAGLLIMTVAAILTVRWLLARKEKRKHRGNAHWIDIGADARMTRLSTPDLESATILVNKVPLARQGHDWHVSLGGVRPLTTFGGTS